MSSVDEGHRCELRERIVFEASKRIVIEDKRREQWKVAVAETRDLIIAEVESAELQLKLTMVKLCKLVGEEKQLLQPRHLVTWRKFSQLTLI